MSCSDVDIALVGDDGLSASSSSSVSAALMSASMCFMTSAGMLQLFEHLVVALEDLDGVPALLLLGHVVHDSLFDVGDGVLDRAGEGVHAARSWCSAAAWTAASAASMMPVPFRAEISTTGQPS